MRFLVGRGDKEIVILNTRKVSSEPKFYKLDDIKYERIMTVRLRSESDEQYECHIACKSTAMKQIVVFDIVEEEKSKQPDEKYQQATSKRKPGKDKNNEKVGKDKTLKSLKVMNFMNAQDPDMQVKISYNLNSVVLVNGEENFILEQRKEGDREYQVQIKLTALGLKEKMVRFILSDEIHRNSFYFIVCN
jgi:hypothetical protein